MSETVPLSPTSPPHFLPLTVPWNLRNVAVFLDASDEIGLLFDVALEDLTPDTAFVYEDHKLGVAFCAGVPLFQEARTRFHELNPSLAAGDDDMLCAELEHCTRAILLISADFYSGWNTRCVSDGARSRGVRSV